MNMRLSRRANAAPWLLILAGAALLGGCITSQGPVLTDAQPLLGDHPRVQFYVLRDGTAEGPNTKTFRWQDGRYVPVGQAGKELRPFTLHAFEGPDLIAQSFETAQKTEYGIMRRLADGAYLIFAVEEKDADDATRAKYCTTDTRNSCLVTSREALLAFAHATAAKAHTDGGLAVVVAK